MVVKKSKIEIEVGLDKDNMPIEIMWRSSDAPASYPVQNAKAMLISFLDRESRDTLKIDLWAKDMEVAENGQHDVLYSAVFSRYVFQSNQ